jgi:hypothetical protein
MATLLAWEYDSYLYGPQKLEIYFHPTGLEYEAAKMAGVDQRL